MKRHLLLSALPLLAADPAVAADHIWDGGDKVNTNWTDADNWDGTAPAAGDRLLFASGITGGDVDTHNDFAAGTDFAGLAFGATGYVVNGNTFDLLSGGVTLDVVGTGLVTVNPAVTLRAVQSWDTGTADDRLTMEGAVNLNGTRLTFNGTGLTVLNGGISGTGGSTVVITMDIGSSGGVRFGGSGAFTYAGPTTVNEGVLEVNGAISVSAITLNAGGVLGGSGSTHRVTSTGGVIQPGRVAGTTGDDCVRFSVGNGLVCDPATDVILNIAGTTAGSGYDQLVITGTVTLGGSELILHLASGWRPTGLSSFTLIDNDGLDNISGQFSGIADGATFTDADGFVTFRMDYHGGDGNDVVIRVVQVNATGTTITWDGGDAAATNWNTALNWDPNTVPAPGDSLSFPSGITAADRLMSNNLSNGTSFHRLTFADTGYQLSGNSTTLTGGIEATHAGGTTTLSNGLNAWVDQTFRAANGADLVFDGMVSLGSVATDGNALTLDADHASSVITLNGDLFGIAATDSLIIDGPGNVVFNNPKTFAAPLKINAGASLNINNGAALGTAGADTEVDGTLVFNAPAVTLAEPLRIDGRVTSLSGSHSLTGSVALDSSAEFASIGTSALTVTGVISGTGLLEKSGTGEMTLGGTGDNTWTGGTQISDGLLKLEKSESTAALPGGTITIGDQSGAAAELRLMNDLQIGNNAAVKIAGDGLFNLNGHKGSIDSLVFTGPGVVDHEGSWLSILSTLAVEAAASGAVINGGTLGLGSEFQEFHVADGPAGEDLLIKSFLSSSGTAPCSKTGQGVLSLTESTSFAGTLRIREGTVNIAGNCYPIPILLDGAAVALMGTGSVRSIEAAAGGMIAPGGGALATLTATTGASLNAATTLQIQLQAPVAGSGYDQLDVTHANLAYQIDTTLVHLNGATLAVSVLGGFSAAVGDQFTILSLGDILTHVDGEFAGLPEGTYFSVGGRGFHISYRAGSGGNDVVLTHLPPPSGITKRWNGLGVDGNWTTAGNWVGGVAPSAGDALVFPAGAARKANANTFAPGTIFNGIAIEEAGYALSGNRVHLLGGISSTHGSADPVTVTLPVRALVAVAISANGRLVMEGEIDTGGSIVTFDKSGPGNLVMNGVISGTGGICKTGAGNLYINGLNTFADQARIREGVLNIQNAQSLGVGDDRQESGTIVEPGAKLVVAANSPIAIPGERLRLTEGTLESSGLASEHSWGGYVDSYPGFGFVNCLVPLKLHGRYDGRLQKIGNAMLRLAGRSTNYSHPLRLEVKEGGVELAQTAAEIGIDLTVGDGSGGEFARLINHEQIYTFTDIHEGSAALEIANGTLDLNGRTETVSSIIFTHGGLITQTGAVPLRVDGDLWVSPADISAVIDAPLSFDSHLIWRISDGAAADDLIVNGEVVVIPGMLRKTANGRAVCNGPITADAIEVEAGVASFNGTVNAPVKLTGGRVEGTGSLGSLTSLPAGGTVAPGNSAGRLTCTEVAWNVATTFVPELASAAAPGGTHDQLRVNGPVELGGAALRPELLAGFTGAAGDRFVIIDNDGSDPVSGTFAGLPDRARLALPGARVFQIDYRGGTGNDVVLTLVESPKPTITSLTVREGIGPDSGKMVSVLTGTGIPHASYQLEASPDLLQWTIKQTAAADAAGLWTFTDKTTRRPGDLKYFFRVRLP